MTGIDAQTWPLLIAASLAMNFYPGPNNLYAISNAAQFGLRTAMTASSGRQVAFASVVLLIGLGLGPLLLEAPHVFLALKIAGALFIAWLGVKLLLSKPEAGLQGGEPSGQWRRLFTDEFLVAYANPKPLIVMLPFLPKLVPVGRLVSKDVFIVGALILLLELVATVCYGVAGLRLRRLTSSAEGLLWFNRIAGTLVVASAALILYAGLVT